MKFDSHAGAELRTWILFFVGIGLVVFFALNESPLNPWWTLIIGAFTSTALIVSAVKSVTGGMSGSAKAMIEEVEKRDQRKDKGDTSSSSSTNVGLNRDAFISFVYNCNAIAV